MKILKGNEPDMWVIHPVDTGSIGRWGWETEQTYFCHRSHSSTVGELARTTPSTDSIHGNIMWNILPPFESTRKLRSQFMGTYLGQYSLPCRALLASFLRHGVASRLG